jgi:hypothetical protein
MNRPPLIIKLAADPRRQTQTIPCQKSVTIKLINFKHRTSNGIGNVIQLHRQFISFHEANEFYNRPGRPIIMSVFFCVGLWLITALLRIRIWIDALFLE